MDYYFDEIESNESNIISYYFDFLPDELLIIILKNSKKDAINLTFMSKNLFKNYNYLLSIIKNGDVNPDEVFDIMDKNSVSVDQLILDPDDIFINSTRFGPINKVEALHDVLLNPDKVISIYYYKKVANYDGEVVIIYKYYMDGDLSQLPVGVSKLNKRICYVLIYHFWNSMHSGLNIEISDDWKVFWNFNLSKYQRESLLFYNNK